ncbi:hypothetical protein Ahy_B02g060476 isoform B [Arachis hypogaea]|uniref:Uncharacterized protein n=1 Tax=Arachis hypogaea TaxID=3818 RepID=A0A445AIL3_ARAHY|nr:hypothetical protein Ahy_B02g060476 isoform B [Arachis hypogaea]
MGVYTPGMNLVFDDICGKEQFSPRRFNCCLRNRQLEDPHFIRFHLFVQNMRGAKEEKKKKKKTSVRSSRCRCRRCSGFDGHRNCSHLQSLRDVITGRREAVHHRCDFEAGER